MKKATTPPDIIPPHCEAAKRLLVKCVCCWKLVLGKDYDFANQLCNICSKALVHLEEEEK